MNLAAMILCGGGSRRMGRDKASLDFRGEAMLARVVRLQGEAFPLGRVLCVAAREQALPPLPDGVRIVHDRQDHAGPLEALAAGLAALQDADAVFVTTCDAPLLVPELPKYLASLLGNHDAAVPRIDDQHYPLTAVYRPSVLPIAEARLSRGERRVIDFVAELDTRFVGAAELQAVDPQLLSLHNCNTPEEYQQLLARISHQFRRESR